MSDSKTRTASFPILGILGCIFITLKLCHVIDWSWWWVTAPFWGVFPLILVVLIFGVVVAALADTK